VHWGIEGEADEALFDFRWVELKNNPATTRQDSEFCINHQDSGGPEALGGVSKRYFTEVSYVYELAAPMATVVDLTERDRTMQISNPVV
jgi:hypothetical protein